MNENYEILPTGVIKQRNIQKINYNYEYSNDYNKYGNIGDNFAHLRLGVLLGALGKTPLSILDVGYGNGDFLKAASKIIPNCYGSDISDYPVPPNCTKVNLDNDKYYDVICFFDSLEHFEDIDIIGSLNCEYIFISVPWCHYFNHTWFSNWYHRKENEHLYHFNKEALENHFAKHGYTSIYSSSFEDTIRKNNKAAYYPNILSCIFRKNQSKSDKILNFYKEKSVIVTGGTGFIGRHIVDMLLSTDIKTIYIFDRTIKHDFKSQKVVYIQGDLLKDIDIIDKLDFDILFHQAANVDTTCRDNNIMIETNVSAFKRIVTICNKKGANIVYASSAATYGNTPIPNTVGNGESPLNIYGESKLEMDNYIRKEIDKLNIKVIGLRYFNVYGNGESHKGKMQSMISQLITKMKCTSIELFEFGEQTRDFVYVKDIALCNLLAGISNISGIYNCGSGNKVDFNTIVNILQAYCPNKIDIKYIKCPYDFFQKETCASMELTSKQLSFVPQFSIINGMYDMLKINNVHC